jgi:U3 small nucleolar RNA-associated protein 14
MPAQPGDSEEDMHEEKQFDEQSEDEDDRMRRLITIFLRAEPGGKSRT